MEIEEFTGGKYKSEEDLKHEELRIKERMDDICL